MATLKKLQEVYGTIPATVVEEIVATCGDNWRKAAQSCPNVPQIRGLRVSHVTGGKQEFARFGNTNFAIELNKAGTKIGVSSYSKEDKFSYYLGEY